MFISRSVTAVSRVSLLAVLTAAALIRILAAAPAAMADDVQVDRISGQDRAATSVEISRRSHPEGATDVVLARVDLYADALSGGPLAAQLDAPVLLTAGDALTPAVVEEIRRLGPVRATLLGGEAALSPTVVDELHREGVLDVRRIAGLERFTTSRAIAEAVLDLAPTDSAYLAVGAHAQPTGGWPDAVGVSALAASQDRPILLTGTDSLPAATEELIAARGLRTLTVIGGSSVVSPGVEDRLRSLATVDRLAGENRYATSLAVNDRARESGSGDEVWIATGAYHADALAAGPAAGSGSNLLLLADGPSWQSQPARQWLIEHRESVAKVHIVGDETVFPAAVEEDLRALFASADPSAALGSTGSASATTATTRSLAPPPVAEWLAGATVRLEVGADLQAVVDAHPAGTHYRLAAGIHRLAAITPKDGDRFTGEPGAVLSGAKVLDGFTRDGDGRFTVGGQTQDAPTSGNYGSTDYSAGNGHYAEEGSEQEVHRGEELFVDGVRQRHVNSLDAVDRPGTWYLDAAADTVTMFDDPAGTLVETSVTPAAFLGDGTADVTVEHLTVRNYASPGNRGAIAARGSTGWTVRAVEARSNHGVGIDIGPGMTVTASRMTDNGQLGLGGRGDLPARAPVTIAGNEIDANATLGYQIGWGAGGAKLVLTTGLLFEHNWVHDNAGKGAWFDIDNRDGTVRSNLVERNGTVGIFWEISSAARIYYNEVYDNQTSGDLSLSAGNIQVVASSDVEVFDNLVRGRGTQEIVAVDQNRGPGLTGLNVHDNNITLTSTWGGGQVGIKDQSDADPYAPHANNTFTHNTYRIDRRAAARPFLWNDTTLTAAQWTALHPTDITVAALGTPSLPDSATPYTPRAYGPVG